MSNKPTGDAFYERIQHGLVETKQIAPRNANALSFLKSQQENETLRAEVERLKAVNDLLKAERDTFRSEVEWLKGLLSRPVINPRKTL